MRVDAKVRRFTIGTSDTMSAEEARTRALQLRAEHQPKTILQLANADRPAMTFRELSQDLLQARDGVWKPSTLKAVSTYLNANGISLSTLRQNLAKHFKQVRAARADGEGLNQ